jgi:hypothetical protein
MEEAQVLFNQTQAANMARIRRLEKQQEFLRRRGKDMLRRGLKTLDELDEIEEKERQEKAKETQQEQQVPTPLAPEQPFEMPPGATIDELLSFGPDLLFSESQGFVFENPPTSQGS